MPDPIPTDSSSPAVDRATPEQKKSITAISPVDKPALNADAAQMKLLTDDIVRFTDPNQQAIWNFAQASAAEDERKAAAVNAAKADQARKTAALYEGYLKAPRPDIHKPQYQQYPTAPQYKGRSPFEALVSPLAGLVIFAGAFGAKSATATINAAAEAMEAQKKGDKEAYERARTEYKDNLERTIRLNEDEHRAYQDSISDRKRVLDERLADINATATMYQNQAVAASARSGNVSALNKQISALGKFAEMSGLLKKIYGEKDDIKDRVMQSAIQEAAKKGLTGTELFKEAVNIAAPILAQYEASTKAPKDISDHEKDIRARISVLAQKPENAGKSQDELRVMALNEAKLGARAGAPNTAAAILDTTQHPELQGLEGKAYLDKLKQVNPAVAATIDSIVRGDTPYPTRSDANSQAIRNAVNLADPTYSSATAGIIADTKRRYADNRTPTAPGGQITAGNTVVRHIARLEEAAKQLRNTNTRTLNLARAKLGQLTQFPELAAMQADARAVTGEIDRFLTAKAPTVTGMKEWSGIINGTATPDEIKAVAKALRNLAQDRFIELGDSYNRGVLAVDTEGRPDQQNPRFKPWTFWINEPWREIVKGGEAGKSPASGLPDAKAIDEELRRRGG
jgi:hypothetical protein